MPNIIKTTIQRVIKKIIGPFQYIFNDPNVDVKAQIPVPTLPNPAPYFTVQGMKENDARSLQTYYSMVHTLAAIHEALPLDRWAATGNLAVNPTAGKDFNAYYDRRALKFFYETNASGKMVYTCESPDVVCHELGHAILDSVRPDLWNMQCLEISAFHEAFGDIVSMMTALTHRSIVSLVINQTGGDLHQSNVVSKLAEELGEAINAISKGKMGIGGALRNANNNFKYIEPESLPFKVATDLQLAGECHNFSRVFSGAWYDCLRGIYEFEKKNMSCEDALMKANKNLMFITLKAIPLAAAMPRFYKSVAKAMIASSRSNNFSQYEPILKQVFFEKRIINQNEVSTFSAGDADAMIQPTDTVFSMGDTLVVRRQSENTTVGIANVGISALSDGENLLQVDLPNESYYEFKNGILVEEIPFDKELSVSVGICSVQSHFENDEIEFGNLPIILSKEFVLQDNKIVRTHFK